MRTLFQQFADYRPTEADRMAWGKILSMKSSLIEMFQKKESNEFRDLLEVL